MTRSPPRSAVFARLPQRVGAELAQHGKSGAQLARAHGLRQHERVQPFAEQLRQPFEHPPVARRACSTHSDGAACRCRNRHSSSVIPTCRASRNLPRSASIGASAARMRLVVFHLVGQLAPAAETLARLEVMPQVRIAARQAIQLGEVDRSEAPRKTGARQAQSLADGANTHARETLE